MFTSAQLRAGRALVRMDQRKLAEVSGVSVETVKRLERAEGQVPANVATADKIKRALEGKGVVFIPENGEGPGVRLRKRQAATA